jgi:hypothetical protein
LDGNKPSALTAPRTRFFNPKHYIPFSTYCSPYAVRTQIETPSGTNKIKDISDTTTPNIVKYSFIIPEYDEKGTYKLSYMDIISPTYLRQVYNFDMYLVPDCKYQYTLYYVNPFGGIDFIPFYGSMEYKNKSLTYNKFNKDAQIGAILNSSGTSPIYTNTNTVEKVYSLPSLFRN